MTHFVDGVYSSDTDGLHVIVRGGWSVPQQDGTSVDGRSVAAYDLLKSDGKLYIEKLEIYAVGKASTLCGSQGLTVATCRIRPCL